MQDNIQQILANWGGSSDEDIRRIRSSDGTQRVQIRVDQGAFQGVLEMHLQGRPDGHRPYGRDFALEYFQDQLQAHRDRLGTDAGFSLTHAACEELFEEASRIYGRYIFLLQMRDYDGVIADTERNMELFRFVGERAERAEDREQLYRWWPYILRIHGSARALKEAEAENIDEALALLRQTQQKVAELVPIDCEEFNTEWKRSLTALAALMDEIEGMRPASREEELQQELQRAIRAENFERAAEVRTELVQLFGEERNHTYGTDV